MINKTQLSRLLFLICDSELSDFEKQILCHLINESNMLSISVRFTLESIGPVANVALSETAVKLSHGADMEFDSMLEEFNSPFLLSTCHGGWDAEGNKISLKNFSLPGEEGSHFYCSFFFSPKLLDSESKLLIVTTDEIKKINVASKQFV